MKFQDYDFRSLDRKFLYLYGVNKKILEKTNLSEPVYGYSYIDSDDGIVFRILGDSKNNLGYKDKKEINLKRKLIENCEVEFSDVKFPDIVSSYDLKHYDNKNRLSIRDHKHLDNLRDAHHPDNIKIVIPYEEGYVEELYVSSFDYIKSADTYIFKVLKNSIYHDEIKENSIVACKYVQQGKKNAMIFIGMAEKV